MTIHSGMIDSSEMEHILSTLVHAGYLDKGEFEHESFGGFIYLKAYPNESVPLQYHHFIFCYLLPIFSAIEMEITLDLIAAFYRNEFETQDKPGHGLYKMIMTLIDIIQAP